MLLRLQNSKAVEAALLAFHFSPSQNHTSLADAPSQTRSLAVWFLASLMETGPLVCPAASCSIAFRHGLVGLGKDTASSSLLPQMSSHLFPHLVVMVGGHGDPTWDHPPVHQAQPVMFGFQFFLKVGCLLGFPSGSAVKNPPAMRKTQQEPQVQSQSREDPLEKEMATYSSILTWRIPWTEEPGEVQSRRSQKSQTQLSS